MTKRKTEPVRSVFGLDLELTFRFVAEISSIILLAGFVAATVLNQMIFSTWGLNFISLADPTDVLMSGMGFLFDAMLLLLIGWIAWYALNSEFLLSNFINRRAEKPSPFVIIPAAATIALGLLAMAYALPELSPSSWWSNNAGWVDVSSASAHSLSQLSYGAAVFVYLKLHRTKLDKDRKILRLVALAGSALALASATIGALNLIGLRAELGYQPDILESPGLAAETCTDGAPLVLWMGSSFTVARCSEGSEAFVVRVEGQQKFVPSAHSGMCRQSGINPLFDCAVFHGAAKTGDRHFAPARTLIDRSSDPNTK